MSAINIKFVLWVLSVYVTVIFVGGKYHKIHKILDPSNIIIFTLRVMVCENVVFIDCSEIISNGLHKAIVVVNCMDGHFNPYITIT